MSIYFSPEISAYYIEIDTFNFSMGALPVVSRLISMIDTWREVGNLYEAAPSLACLSVHSFNYN